MAAMQNSIEKQVSIDSDCRTPDLLYR